MRPDLFNRQFIQLDRRLDKTAPIIHPRTISTRDLSTNINSGTKWQARIRVRHNFLPRCIRNDVGLADVFVREHHSVQIGESPPAHDPCSLFDGTPGTRPPYGARCDGRGHAGSEGGPGARCALPVDNTAQVVTQSRVQLRSCAKSSRGSWPRRGGLCADESPLSWLGTRGALKKTSRAVEDARSNTMNSPSPGNKGYIFSLAVESSCVGMFPDPGPFFAVCR